MERSTELQQLPEQAFEKARALIEELENLKEFAESKDPRALSRSERHSLLRIALAYLDELSRDPAQEASKVVPLVERLRACTGALSTGRTNDVPARHYLDESLANTQRVQIDKILGRDFLANHTTASL